MFSKILTLFPLCLALFGSPAVSAPSGPPSAIDNPSFGDIGLYPTGNTLARTIIHDDRYGTHETSYFVNYHGFVIIDGDVVYGTIDDLSRAEAAAVDSSHSARAFSRIGAPWPGAIVFYRYASEDEENEMKSRIDAGIEQWVKKAPGLEFRQLATGKEARGGVVTMHVGDGCSAYVGYPGSDLESHLFFGPGCTVHSATHELGHVLGIYHCTAYLSEDQDTNISRART